MGGNSSQPKNAGATAKQGVQSSGTSEHVEAQPLKPSRSSAVEESPVRHRRRPRRRRRRPTLPEYIKSHILIFAGADTSEMGGDSNQPQSASASSEQRIQSSNFSPDQLIDDLLVGPCKLLSEQQTGIILFGSSKEDSDLEQSISSEAEEGVVPPTRPLQCRTRRRRLSEDGLMLSRQFAGADTSEMGGDSNQPQSASASSEQRIQSSNFSPDQLIDDLLVGPCKLLSVQQTGIILFGSSKEDSDLEQSISSEAEEGVVPPTRPLQCRTRRRRLSEDGLVLSRQFAGADTSEMGGDSNQPQSASASSEQRIQSSNFSPDQLIDDLLVGPCKLLSVQQTGIILFGSSKEDSDLEQSISSEAEEGVVPPTRPLQCRTRRRRLSEDGLILSRQFAGADTSEMGGDSNQPQSASASSEQRIQSSIFSSDQLIDDWLVGPSKLLSAICCIIYSWKKAITSAISQWLKGMTTFRA
ncbi:uncharacterized protein LOC132388282 isoform X1 [Hypanus sabinus]|uniref:uncharacterized protein LOC132388282 isoform X1 n=1 Tax=Hypanus sabinus TaxID=79690 RepID=UPI0028C475CD|nr:uncharacterized protein LOC132388282 isoform X1 [Hypanus sabinus]